VITNRSGIPAIGFLLAIDPRDLICGTRCCNDVACAFDLTVGLTLLNLPFGYSIEQAFGPSPAHDHQSSLTETKCWISVARYNCLQSF
jgi:hypothetical protein